MTNKKLVRRTTTVEEEWLDGVQPNMLAGVRPAGPDGPDQDEDDDCEDDDGDLLCDD